MAGLATRIGDGRKTVTTAGTRVQLATAEPTTGTTPGTLIITALSTNTGIVVVGSVTCVAAAGTRTGTPLNSGDSLSMDFAGGLSQVYLDSTVNGEGVSYTYLAA